LFLFTFLFLELFHFIKNSWFIDYLMSEKINQKLIDELVM